MSCTRRAATPDASEEEGLFVATSQLGRYRAAIEVSIYKRCALTRNWRLLPQAAEANKNFFGGHSRAGADKKSSLLACGKLCTWEMGKRDTCFVAGEIERESWKLETETRNCAGHSRFVFCVNTYQCVISFSSQYGKSKQGWGKGQGREEDVGFAWALSGSADIWV